MTSVILPLAFFSIILGALWMFARSQRSPYLSQTRPSEANSTASSSRALHSNHQQEKHMKENITPSAREAAAHETLVAGLRDAHALEKQAITVLESQLKMLTSYPDLHARVTEHIVETRDQARRLEAGLEACGGSTSMVKDAIMSVMGYGQSSVQGFGDDAVLKAVLADMMTEHLEIATYRTLLSLADMAGKPELRERLEETLQEEEAMAAWFDENLDSITQRFIDLKASEQQADEAPRDEVATKDAKAPAAKASPRDTAALAFGADPTPAAKPGLGGTQGNSGLGGTQGKPGATPVAATTRTSGG